MKKIIFGVILTCSIVVNAQGQTGQKELNLFSDAKEKAAAEHKNILLYFSGSDWCAPCVKFRKNFISNPGFKDISENKLIVFNADFPRLKAHALLKEKEADNKNLAEAYNKSGHFPMILLLDANGKVIREWDGYPKESPEEFIAAFQ